jgi:dynein heavy chain 1
MGDDDIVGILTDVSYIEIILPKIFNIDEVDIDGGLICGIKAAGERILFDDGVPLDRNVNVLIDNFEKKFKSTMEEKIYRHLVCWDDFSSGEGPAQLSEMIEKAPLLSDRRHEALPSQIRSLLYSKYARGTLYPSPRIINDKLIMDSIYPIEYGYEYFPPDEIITTDLTLRIFGNILISFKSTSGIILYGKSGTGKTETVKHFCKHVGRQVFLFCCDEKCDFKTIKRLINGSISTNSWICFDEINRLNSRIMSSVCELIAESSKSIKIFLTMNVGYKGRYELPRNIKSLFGVLRVEEPNFKEIFEYYLERGDLADKAASLFSNLRDLMKNVGHYDFGLRAIKTVLSRYKTCGNKKDASELLEFLYSFYVPLLRKEDRSIFEDEVKKCFGFRIELRDYLEDAFSNKNGVILLGEGCTGKSTCLAKFKGRKTMKYFNPYTMEIFGDYNEVTGEWSDSLFIKELREGRGDAWFIFDAPLESSWIENCNSILDDNLVMCLRSGERIKIPKEFKFIFETDTIENVTPATLTRMQIIYFERDEAIKPKICDVYNFLCDTEGGRNFIKYQELNINTGTCIEDIVMTGEAEFYSHVLLSLAERERVIFVEGPPGVGKTTLVNALFGDKFLFINVKGNDLSKIFSNTRPCGNFKIYNPSAKTVVFIDGLNIHGDDALELREKLREYSEYKRIGDTLIENTVFICAYNPVSESLCSNKTNGRLSKKVFTLIMDEPRELEYIVYRIFEEKLKDTRAFDDVRSLTKTLVGIFHELKVKGGFVTLRDLKRFIDNFHEAIINGDYDLHLLFKELVVHFDDEETILKNLKVFMEEENISFRCVYDDIKKEYENYSLKGDKVLVDNIPYIHRICNISKKRKGNLILKGKRLSGKTSLIKACCKLIGKSIVEYGEEKADAGSVVIINEKCLDNIKQLELFSDTLVDESLDSKIVIFVEDERCLSKAFLNRCFVVEHRPANSEIIRKCLERFEGLGLSREERLEGLLLRAQDMYKDNLYKFYHFVNTFLEKFTTFSSEQEKRQRFLMDGISKIKTYEEQMKTMNDEIELKKDELLKLTKEGKEKIVRIMEEQSLSLIEEERLRESKDELQAEIEVSRNKKARVDGELDRVLPLIQESIKSIREISKSHLSEIKSMTKPPEIIKLVVEGVYYLIEGNKKVEWKSLLQFVKRDDFISRVLNFKLEERIKPSREGVWNHDELKKIVANLLFTFERASNASKACGPLYSWVVANYKYITLEAETRPLKYEIQKLESEIDTKSERIKMNEQRLVKLRININVMREEYSLLIDNQEKYKNEILRVQKMLEVRRNLLESVRDERIEWGNESAEDIFKKSEEYISNLLISTKNTALSCCTLTGSVLSECRRNVFIHDKYSLLEEKVEIFKENNFMFVSLKDRSIRSILRNAILYRNSLFIKDCDFYSAEVYKALKCQMEVRAFVWFFVPAMG